MPSEEVEPQLDPCSAREATEAACNGECVLAYMYEVDEAVYCGITDEQRICVEPGAAESRTATFWREVDGRTQFVPVNHRDCGFEVAPSWERCDGTADDPSACGCFCVEGVCPGQADSVALHACGFEEACAPFEIDAYLDYRAPASAAACVLEALRARTTARFQVSLYWGLELPTYEVFIPGGDEVLVTQRYRDDVVECPVDDEWFSAERCTLREPAYFDECLPTAGGGGPCLDPTTWFTSCEPAAALCD